MRAPSPLQATQRLVYSLQSHAHFMPFKMTGSADLSHGSPELVGAFSSLLFQCSTVTEVDKGLTKEIKLPNSKWMLFVMWPNKDSSSMECYGGVRSGIMDQEEQLNQTVKLEEQTGVNYHSRTQTLILTAVDG